MIGDRVRWAHDFPDRPETAKAFATRGGIIRAVCFAAEHWRVLVQHDDGTYGAELASNLAAVEPGSPADVAERDLAEARAELGAERDRTGALLRYITDEGLVEDAPEPCAAAIELLKTFQAELLAVGAARDAADRMAAELAIERDQMRAERDAAVAEIEATKKRKRSGGRLPEHES